MGTNRRFNKHILIITLLVMILSIGLSANVVSAEATTNEACSFPTNELSGQGGFSTGALGGFSTGALGGFSTGTLGGFSTGALAFAPNGELITPAGQGGFSTGALDANDLLAILEEAQTQYVDPNSLIGLWTAISTGASYGSANVALVIADDYPDDHIFTTNPSHGEQVERVFVDMIVAASTILAEPSIIENVDIYRVDVTQNGQFVPIDDGLPLEPNGLVQYETVVVPVYPANLNVISSTLTDSSLNPIGGIAKRIDDTIDSINESMYYDAVIFNFSVGLIPCEAEDVLTGTEGKTIDWDANIFASEADSNSGGDEIPLFEIGSTQQSNSDGTTGELEPDADAAVPLFQIEAVQHGNQNIIDSEGRLIFILSNEHHNKYFLWDGDQYDAGAVNNTIFGNEEVMTFSANNGEVFWSSGRQQIGVASPGENSSEKDQISRDEQLILDLVPIATEMSIRVHGHAEVVAKFYYEDTHINTVSMANRGNRTLHFSPGDVFNRVVLSADSGSYGIKGHPPSYTLNFKLLRIKLENNSPFAYFQDVLGLTEQEATTVLNNLLSTYTEENNDDVTLLRDMLNKHLAYCAAPNGKSFIPLSAAGNYRPFLGSPPVAPASWSNMIGVGAFLGFGDGDTVYPEASIINPLDPATGGDLATFTQDGDISAGGAWTIVGYDSLGNPIYAAGTSYASPVASAVAALIALGGGDFNCGTLENVKSPITQDLKALGYNHDNDPVEIGNLQFDFSYEPVVDPTPMCMGYPATIWVDDDGIIHSTNPDQNGLSYASVGYRLEGTSQLDDVIVGTPGNDIIKGHSGFDLICGLAGNDWIWGDNDNDIILAGGGNDLVWGGNGNDEIDGGVGAYDRMFGDNGADYLYDPDGVESAHGENGDDTIIVTLADGWRKPNGQARFDGWMHGGLGSDEASLTLCDPSVNYFINTSGDRSGEIINDEANYDTIYLRGTAVNSGSIITWDNIIYEVGNYTGC